MLWNLLKLSGKTRILQVRRLSNHQRPQLPLAVRTYNYAFVPAEVLAGAEQLAAEIFRRAGIELAWIQCPRSPREVETFPACTQISNDPRAVTLKILSESMASGVVALGLLSFAFDSS